MQPRVQLRMRLEDDSVTRDLMFRLGLNSGRPLYRVMTVAPPMLTTVPITLASPCLLLRSTCSSLHNLLRAIN
jgi:hypothetical protein